MSTSTSDIIHLDHEDSAISLLRMLTKAPEGLANLTLQFGSSTHGPFAMEEDEDKREALLLRIYNALKVNQHIRTLTIIHLKDIRAIDDILAVNKTITKLVIRRTEYEEGDGKVIRRLLRRGPQIELDYATFEDVDTKGLMNAIRKSSTLVSLTVALADLGWCEESAKIYKTVNTCSALTRLDLSGNLPDREDLSGYQDDARVIANMIQGNSTLTELLLAHNFLGRCLDPICSAVQKNSVLKKLDLSFNRICDRGEHSIGTLLKHNSTLTDLNLSGNPISYHTIFDALEKNTTLKTLGCGGPSGDVNNSLQGHWADVMKKNSTLTEISLDLSQVTTNPLIDCITTSFTRALQDKQSLAMLDLSASIVNIAGLAALGEFLKVNKSLVELKVAMYSEFWGPHQRCRTFCEGLQVNCTLKSLWFRENQLDSDRVHRDFGGIAIAEALAVNMGLESLTLRDKLASTERLQMLAVGLERNTTLIELVLEITKIGNDGARILARGLRLNTSLQSLDLNIAACEGVTILADALRSNSFLKAFKIKSFHKQGEEELGAVLNALKVNTSLKQLWLPDHLISKGWGRNVLMEAYRRNAALTCEIVNYDSGTIERFSWHYCRLKQAGRSSWTDSTLPAALWPRALTLADSLSQIETPDLLFRFILDRPDIFKDCGCHENRRKKSRTRKPHG